MLHSWHGSNSHVTSLLATWSQPETTRSGSETRSDPFAAFDDGSVQHQVSDRVMGKRSRERGITFCGIYGYYSYLSPHLDTSSIQHPLSTWPSLKPYIAEWQLLFWTSQNFFFNLSNKLTKRSISFLLPPAYFLFHTTPSILAIYWSFIPALLKVTSLHSVLNKKYYS